MFGEPQLVLVREIVHSDGNILRSNTPYYIPGCLVLHSRVDYRHYGHWAHIADVIVDEKLEVGDVNEGEVSGVEITVRMSLRQRFLLSDSIARISK